MNLKFSLVISFLFLVFGCKETHLQVSKIEGQDITINDSLTPDNEIDAFLKPYREHVKKDLDSVLAYSVGTYSKYDSQFNTAIGNFLVDAIHEEANPIFKKKTNKNIDLVMLNFGSIRSIIPKGNVTIRHIFEIMPFDIDIYVIAYNGKQIMSFADDLAHYKDAHATSKLKIKIDKDRNLVEATLNNEKIDSLKTYYLAISDYTYNSKPDLFTPNDGVYKLNYHIRNMLIDYMKKIDTIRPMVDDRFIQIN